MKYRTFGKTGWKVSGLGHGMWGMGEWSGSDDAESMETLHQSVESGVNFFDTAWVYGNGRSEKLLGQLIKDYPNKKLFISTKIPPKNFKWPMEPFYSLNETYPSAHMKEYVHKSMINLGVGQIDLVLLHGWDDTWAKDEEWQKTVIELKKDGLIKAFGLSIDRWEPENAIEAIRTGLIDAIEVIYNIFDQAPEDKLFPVCKDMNVGVIARVPFDEGTLTDTLTIKSKWSEGDWRNLYFGPENLQSSLDHLESLKADLPTGTNIPELALQFILSNPIVSTTIPGMRKIENVKRNIAASEKKRLTESMIQILRKHRWDRKPTAWAG